MANVDDGDEGKKNITICKIIQAIAIYWAGGYCCVHNMRRERRKKNARTWIKNNKQQTTVRPAECLQTHGVRIGSTENLWLLFCAFLFWWVSLIFFLWFECTMQNHRTPLLQLDHLIWILSYYFLCGKTGKYILMNGVTRARTHSSQHDRSAGGPHSNGTTLHRDSTKEREREKTDSWLVLL